MELIILFIVIIAVYKIGKLHGFCKCEAILQNELNNLMEEIKTMEAYKTGRYVEWEKHEDKEIQNEAV